MNNEIFGSGEFLLLGVK